MASSTSISYDEDSVLVEQNLSVRTLTLNRPRQLNALSFEMISRLLELFLAYEEDANVKLVIVKGKGRAFCAGGDVATVVRQINEGNWRLGAEFFQKEFSLNYLMATYNKPQVSILNGIVMGGGAGASIHGRFRVATENSVFAMPETALGLFPDENMWVLQVLDWMVLKCLLVVLLLTLFHQRMDVIDKCFSRRTVEEILSALEKEATNRGDDFLNSTIQALKKASPMSLKISLRSIREGRLQGVGQCLVREYRMVSHVLKGEISKDFREGCRAILLDKDRNPKWEPSKLDLITNHMVEQYFSRVDDEGWEDLKLPARSNLPVTAIAKL